MSDDEGGSGLAPMQAGNASVLSPCSSVLPRPLPPEEASEGGGGARHAAGVGGEAFARAELLEVQRLLEPRWLGRWPNGDNHRLAAHLLYLPEGIHLAAHAGHHLDWR